MGLPAIQVTASGADDELLGQEIVLLSARINVANYRLLKLIAEFDRRGAWRCGGTVRSCAHWLVAKCGIDLGAARERVRVARRLLDLPLVDAAFAGGDLSFSKARAITRVATPDNEGLLLGLAEQVTAGHLEKVVARYEPVPDVVIPAEAQVIQLADAAEGAAESLAGEAPAGETPGAAGREQAREEAREMFWFQDEDGNWVIHARLPPEQGQLVVKTLEALTRPLVEERKDECKALQAARLRAAAKAIRRHPGESREPVPELHQVEEKISAETFGEFMNQARADAFGNLVEHFLAMAPDYRQLQGLTGAERCQVILHIDVNTLRQQRAGVCCAHGRAHFEDTPWLSAETARRLGCDASLATVLEDEQGRVLNVGRRTRVVPAPVRRALKERDGCCRFPGCSESRYVDAHHAIHWADGGETSLENLVTLCRFHHTRLHAGYFEMRRGAGGGWEFIRAGPDQR